MTQSGAPWLVIGLGNPGPKYEATRHNIGVMAIAQMAAARGAGFSTHRRCGADVATSRVDSLHDSDQLLFARSRGFMNESGGPVACLVGFYKVPIERIVVCHDELDLELGILRLKLGGGDNGHNGLRSVRRSLGSGDFHRVRLGIGRPPGRQDPADFVLRPFAAPEADDLALAIGAASDAIEVLVESGLASAQNRFNG